MMIIIITIRLMATRTHTQVSPPYGHTFTLKPNKLAAHRWNWMPLQMGRVNSDLRLLDHDPMKSGRMDERILIFIFIFLIKSRFPLSLHPHNESRSTTRNDRSPPHWATASPTIQTSPISILRSDAVLIIISSPRGASGFLQSKSR